MSISYCTIGIPARNEENNIRLAMQSILRAVQQLPNSMECEIIVALNGCTDATEAIVKSFLEDSDVDERVEFSMVVSDEGIMEAQRKICATRKRKGPVFFLDADIIVDEECIANLVNALNEIDGAEIVWALPKPVSSKKGLPRILQRILNFTDFFPQVISKRRYLYGKAYGMRSCSLIPDPFPTSCEDVDRNISKLLQLDKGPLVDDIFLTREVVANRGIDGIQMVESAFVMFNPISNLVDFFFSQRRTVIEMKRLDLLFPYQDYERSEVDYLKRKPVKPDFSRLTTVGTIEYHTYRFLYKAVRRLANLEISLKLFLAKNGFRLRPLCVWPIMKSTKTPIAEGNHGK